MIIQIQINIQARDIHVSPVPKKKKLSLLKEKDLLKNLSYQTAHGDELTILHTTELGN